MKANTPFYNWLVEQGLENEIDKEKRKQYHEYFRKQYRKDYNKEHNHSRKRSHVSFNNTDFLQLRAKAAQIGLPVATFIRKAAMAAVEGRQTEALTQNGEGGFTYCHNISGSDIRDYEQCFLKNEQFRQVDRKDSVRMRHIILSFNAADSPHLKRRHC